MRNPSSPEAQRLAMDEARTARAGARQLYSDAEREQGLRPGSLRFLELPSRMGRRLYYRDGRVEEIDHA